VDGPVTSPHEILNPDSLPAAIGFSHAVVAAPGRTVYLGGQAGLDAESRLVSDDLVEQFEQSVANVVEALGAAGGKPEHLVAMQIYVTDVGEYRESLKPLAQAYQKHLGRHYPAIALLGVKELFDPAAKVELVATAVIPA
jgi:enamine deaminase RidA (YjgF/YER057c/UK114 family)